MNDRLRTLFLENPDIDQMIEDFCSTDPELLRARREFYETAREAAAEVGFELYNRFERRFGIYLGQYAELYYLFGLGLRQEVLAALTARSGPARPRRR